MVKSAVCFRFKYISFLFDVILTQIKIYTVLYNKRPNVWQNLTTSIHKFLADPEYDTKMSKTNIK